MNEKRDYWNKRFKKYRHTGYKYEQLYRYDQPLRLRAIMGALSNVGIQINQKLKILDVGCGTGDLIHEFAKKGAEVTGVDISEYVAEYARKRFKNVPQVEIFASKIEDIEMPFNSFDLVTSITTLQHITEETQFSIALKKIVSLTKVGGHILLLESAPYKKNENPHFSRTTDYLTIRIRKEWIDALKKSGCSLVKEISYPQWGNTFLNIFKKMIDSLYDKGKNITATINSENRINFFLNTRLFNHLMRGILIPFYPIDHWLFLPFPKKFSYSRILIFKKGA